MNLNLMFSQQMNQNIISANNFVINNNNSNNNVPAMSVTSVSVSTAVQADNAPSPENTGAAVSTARTQQKQRSTLQTPRTFRVRESAIKAKSTKRGPSPQLLLDLSQISETDLEPVSTAEIRACVLERKFTVDSPVFAIAVRDVSSHCFGATGVADHDDDDNELDDDEFDDGGAKPEPNDDDGDDDGDDDNNDDNDAMPAKATKNGAIVTVDLHCRSQAHPRLVDGIGSTQRPDADGYFYADAAQHWSPGFGKKKNASDDKFSKFNWRPKKVDPNLMQALGVKRVRQLRQFDANKVAHSAAVDAFVYVSDGENRVLADVL